MRGVLEAGVRIAHYRIEGALGRGGMGEVYAAFDERLERRVALKLLPAARAADAEARGRMLREARAASALKHPGIVTIYEIGEAEQRTYIAMELVEGETLAHRLARRGRLPVDEALALARQAADALTAAHDAGILHRDFKSANLMVDARGHLKVLDFGLSKRMTRPEDALATAETPPAGHVRLSSGELGIDPAATTAPPTSTPPPLALGSGEPVTALGVIMGTPGTASLELLRGQEADHRTDVFSLGALLYELVTGRLPFTGASWGELCDRMESEEYAPPSRASEGAVDERFDAVVAKALRARAEDRWDDARELMAAAAAALAPRNQPRRGSIARRAFPLAAALLAGGTAAAWWLGRRGTVARAPEARPPAPVTATPAAPAGPPPRSPMRARSSST